MGLRSEGGLDASEEEVLGLSELALGVFEGDYRRDVEFENVNIPSM